MIVAGVHGIRPSTRGATTLGIAMAIVLQYKHMQDTAPTKQHEGFHMFPEYRELISKLKHSDFHFNQMFEKHNALDQRIKNMEASIELATPEAIEALKKEKLLLKDQLYAHLQHKHFGA